MPTSYDVVDNSFLNKITDKYLIGMDIDDVEALIDKYRNSAQVQFKQCLKLKDRDEVNRQYNQELTDEEIEILSNFMVLEWMKPIINNLDLIKQRVTTKDYKLTSQAEHLKQLVNSKKSILVETKRMVTSYTYTENSLGDLYD